MQISQLHSLVAELLPHPDALAERTTAHIMTMNVENFMMPPKGLDLLEGALKGNNYLNHNGKLQDSRNRSAGIRTLPSTRDDGT